jgi:DNA polymerase III subunit epsilon
MREIILDTETTGLDPRDGHRIVEIACVEIINLVPTGQNYHVYINPQRDMPDEAFRVHGLSSAFLSDKPLFADIMQDFLSFIQDTPLVIHNAEFDLKFLNYELTSCNSSLSLKNKIIDTLLLARKKFPGASNSLDALCARFKIDNSKRTKHNALLDSQILADVYCELVGGRQSTLSLAQDIKVEKKIYERKAPLQHYEPIISIFEADLIQKHEKFVAELGDKALWANYTK